MKILKQYWLVIAILLLVVVSVLFRTFSRHDFRYDAFRWAEPTISGSNIIAEDQITKLGGGILLITLAGGDAINEQLRARSIMIDPDSILEKENLSLIRKNKGTVILLSDDNSVSAKVWMVLSEMGMKNILILRFEGEQAAQK